MALRVSPPTVVALCLLFSLLAVARCAPLASNTTSVAAEVHAVQDDGEGLLRLPSGDDVVVVSDAVARDGEVPVEEEVVNPVAEPDPDRSHPDSNGEEDDELTAKKLKEQVGDDEEEKKDEEKTKKKHSGNDAMEKKEKKKIKKHHACDGKKKKGKKHHKSNDNEAEEEEEEKRKKQIHRHHRVEEEKTKKRTQHDNGNDSDDDEQEKKKAKRWRKKAISVSRFGHGRRSQREESQTEEVKN